MIFALAGNQNCGKTTLFNQLTGSNQHVGNFPGVTVERKDGEIRGRRGVTVVDLPGIYSLSPYTSEEIVTRDFLLNQHPDGIINIVDATNIERNFYLSMQLIELNIPMVVALNMMDEFRANGGTIKLRRLSEELGVPVVPISAVKNEGIDELIETAIATARDRRRPARLDFCSGAVHRAIHAIAHLVEDHAERIGVPPRFAATKLVEGDLPMLERLELSQNEQDMVEHSVTEMETELGTDREAALADMRYSFIDSLCAQTVVKPTESREHLRSLRMDNVLTHKYLAIPIFLIIMLVIFWLTFGVIGTALSDLLSMGIDALTAAASDALTRYGLNPVIHSLVIDGIFAGVGSVLSFLPIIVVLFFFLSILEDSGYMARVDRPDHRLFRQGGRRQHSGCAHRHEHRDAAGGARADFHARRRGRVLNVHASLYAVCRCHCGCAPRAWRALRSRHGHGAMPDRLGGRIPYLSRGASDLLNAHVYKKAPLEPVFQGRLFVASANASKIKRLPAV